MKKVLVAAILLMVSSCDFSVKEEQVDAGSRVVAKVGDRTISLAQLDEEVKRYESLTPVTPGKRREDGLVRLRQAVLTHLIDILALEIEADRIGVTVSPEELDNEITALLGKYDEPQFGVMLAGKKIDFDKWKGSLKSIIKTRKLANIAIDSRIVIDEKEILRYYERNKEGFNWPERVRARQIVVSDEAKAAKIRKQLLKKADFKELARVHSMKPEATSGGDLGFFPRGVMPPVIEDAVFSLKVGEISEVVESNYGFHIFKLIKKEKPHAMSLNEAHDRIREILKARKREEEYSKWLESLKKNTVILIYPEVLLASPRF